MTHEDLECLPVRLKSCGSVFSSFLSYILVIDLSGLFQGVSRRFRASTDGRTVIRMPNRMARWLAGGKSVKRKLSKINFYQHQTLSNIKIDKYKQLFNQQKSSDRASEANKIFLELGVTCDRAKCFPVRLKSCGSVFSSFLSYILVIDLSGLFQGVSRSLGGQKRA